jgi:pimeloyl-ACP methyl ester carboxylesterase
MPSSVVRRAVVLLAVAASVFAFIPRGCERVAGKGLPPSGEYLDLGGTKIYYEQCGSGPAVVLLHDGLVHAVTWDGVWDSLCGKYRVIRYDRRGYGRSDPPTVPFSPTDDLYKLLTRLNVSHAVVVGSSSGGALAIDFALEHPRMVDGLLLLGPVLHGMRDSAYFVERGDKNNEPVRRGDLKAAAENWSRDRFLIAGENPSARKKLYDALAGSPQNLKYSNRFETQLSPPAAARLSETKAPALILAGEADIADVHAYCGAINAGIRESARVVVKGAGHFIQLEKPEEVIARLNRFVPRAERAQADVPAALLNSYAGQYRLGDTTLTVRVEGEHLLGTVSGAGDFFFFPESQSRFFARLQDADIEFERDASGKVARLVVYQSGTTTKWARIGHG